MCCGLAVVLTGLDDSVALLKGEAGFGGWAAVGRCRGKRGGGCKCRSDKGLGVDHRLVSWLAFRGKDRPWARLQISFSDRDAELKCCLGMELIRGHYVLERGVRRPSG